MQGEIMSPLRPYSLSLLATGVCLSLAIWAVPRAESEGGKAPKPTPPYPPSPVIRGVEWAPAKTIVRRAKDGDNWPVTWADDDAIYTTWGDGTGFPSKTEKKLSCGFARVSGAADDF